MNASTPKARKCPIIYSKRSQYRTTPNFPNGTTQFARTENADCRCRTTYCRPSSSKCRIIYAQPLSESMGPTIERMVTSIETLNEFLRAAEAQKQESITG